MKTFATRFSGVAAGATLILAVMFDVPATAATLTGTFQVDVVSTLGIPLSKSIYFGNYSFDNTNFSGTGNVSPANNGLKLNFNFANLFDASIAQTYTELDDIDSSLFPELSPRLSLSNGTITGLNYLVATSSGTFSIDGSTFLYSVNNSADSGLGTVKYSVPKSSPASIPESSTVLALGILGLWGVAPLSQVKRQKKELKKRLLAPSP